MTHFHKIAQLDQSEPKRSRVKTLFEAPLFCPIYHCQPINRVLSPDTVKRLVKEGAKLADVDPVEAREFSDHSMRVGAAQDLLRRGFDTAAIMRAGGWSSTNVVSRYLGLCLEFGGNSPAAFSEHVDLGLIRPRGQG